MREKNGDSKVIKAGIGYTVGNYMLKGLSFLTVPIFSRLLPTADYGVFNTYLAYQTIVFLLVGLALHTSLKNAKYKYGADFAKYNSNCILVVFLNLIIWAAAANLLYPLYAQAAGFSRLVVNLLLIDSFGTALIQFFNVYVGLDYRYASFLKISAFNAVANLGISLFLILTLFRSDRATGRILGNAIPVGIIAVALLCYFWKKAAPKLNREYTKFGLGYSLPLIPHGISQVILSQFDRVMIRSLNGDAKAGIYSFAYNIFSIINVTTNSLDNVWAPWFYERMEEKDYESIKKYSSKYAFGMLLFSIMVMLLTPELVMLLGAREYWDAMYSVIPIVVGGYFMFLCTLPSSVEYYCAKTKFIALGTGGAAAVNVVLNLIFIPRFGYLAAAYTTLAAYLFYFIFHYVIAIRIQKKCMFDTGKLAIYILTAAAAGVFSLLCFSHWLLRFVPAALTGILALVWLEREFGFIERIRRK